MPSCTITHALRWLLVLGVFCASTEAKIVRAHRRHAVTNVPTLYRRQTPGTDTDVYPVLGVTGLGVNTTAPRLEIRELERNADLFNVYLLGLQRWQNTSQDDKFSYFQVAGMSVRFRKDQMR